MRGRKMGALCALLLLLVLLGACTPSPTAMKVDGRRIDAAEYAFYLYYNWLNLGNTADEMQTAQLDEAQMQDLHDSAQRQIVTNEIILAQCEAYDLALSDAQLDGLSEQKDALIESLGGNAAYLTYLQEAGLTDRGYDKFQQNALYYQMLYEYVQTMEGGISYTDEELRQYFAENYSMVQYIQISTRDAQGASLGVQEKEAAYLRAQTVLALAQQEGADFSALMEMYNEQSALVQQGGIVLSRLEAGDSAYLAPAFDLPEGEVGGIYEAEDGYYVVRRMPVSAGYFEQNRDYIAQTAQDWAFSQLLEQWRGTVEVRVDALVEEMNLQNLFTYIE